MALKELTGVVVSDRMHKTRVVQVTRLVRHPVYQRVIRRIKRFKVHDEQNQARVGDEVRMVGSRPISKDKRWRLLSVVRRNPQRETE